MFITHGFRTVRLRLRFGIESKIIANLVKYLYQRAVTMALHNAVLVVSPSVDYRKRPLHWAQYVHYGA